MRPQLDTIGEVEHEREISDFTPPKMSEPKPNTALGVTVTSVVAILLSLPIILAGLWLAYYQDDPSCDRTLQWPVILLGVSVSLVALVGLVGSIWRLTWLVVVYFVAMSAVIAALAAVVVLLYVATGVRSADDGDGAAAGGVDGYQSGYRMEEFSSGWFRRRVEGVGRWGGIRECLNSAGVCSEFNQSYRISDVAVDAGSTPVQSGCCKPPAECGYTPVNPTFWINPSNTAGGLDCLLWSNNQTELCYQCGACKAGFLTNLRKQWRVVDFVLFVALVGLMSIYIFGCCCNIRLARRGRAAPRDKRAHKRGNA